MNNISKPQQGKPSDLFQLLYTSGGLSSTMLGVVKAYREQWNLSPYEAVVSAHIIEETELADCLSKALELQRIKEIPASSIDLELLKNLPYKVARQWCMIPARMDAADKTITAVIADPTQSAGIEELRAALACEFKLAVCERQVIFATIDGVYPLIKFPK